MQFARFLYLLYDLDFFRKFEELKTSEEEKLDRLETTIVAILEHMSKVRSMGCDVMKTRTVLRPRV